MVPVCDKRYNLTIDFAMFGRKLRNCRTNHCDTYMYDLDFDTDVFRFIMSRNMFKMFIEMTNRYIMK